MVRVWGDVRPGVTAGVRPDVRPAERPAGRPAGRSSAAPKKKHLIEAAPCGRLDQMLRTTVWRGEGLDISKILNFFSFFRFLVFSKSLDAPLKRSFVTFDRGGQMGPPRSNDFFFGTADDTGVADDRPTVRQPSDDRLKIADNLCRTLINYMHRVTVPLHSYAKSAALLVPVTCLQISVLSFKKLCG